MTRNMQTGQQNRQGTHRGGRIVSAALDRPVLLIVMLIIAGTSFEVFPMAVVRAGAALALLVQIYQEVRAGSGRYLTSPLFLLGAIALIFFSIVLGVTDTYSPGLPFHTIESFYGSEAERMIVIFGLCCIAAHSLISDGAEPPAVTTSNFEPSPGKCIYLFVAITVMVALANVANGLLLQSGGPLIPEIRSVAPPLLAFCLIYLVHQSIRATGKQKLLIAGGIAMAIASLLFLHEGKKPVFMLVAAFLYWVRLKDISVKKIVILGAIFVPLAIGIMQIVQIVRVPHYSIMSSNVDTPMAMFGNILRAKVVLRQTETRYCLQNVINQHGQQDLSVARQMFWLKGLVPRVLWPDKPNLSLGQQYGSAYCNEQEGSKHTASISLIGQPIIYGGRVGLLLHGGILIACLGGITWLGRNSTSLSAVAAVALLPWLIDFDQDFALYVANAVKFFLVMTPLILLAYGLDVKRRTAKT